MRYVIGDSARLVTPYRGYSWVTIIGYEGDGYCAVSYTHLNALLLRAAGFHEAIQKFFVDTFPGQPAPMAKAMKLFDCRIGEELCI